jgi:general secretion pathway protein G
MKNKFTNKGFTLIELLVVISIIGILLGLSVFGLQGARQSSRDAKRKADVELIRSGLEIYKSDCSAYPTVNIAALPSLVGDGSSSSCPVTNTYISKIPVDAAPSTNSYSYSSNGTTYTLCAALESAPSSPMDISGCGSCTATCNYVVTNP